MPGPPTRFALARRGAALGLGMTEDTPLAAMWRFSRMLRLADGPDEVHKMVIARRELNRRAKRAAEAEGGDAASDGAAAPEPAKTG